VLPCQRGLAAIKKKSNFIQFYLRHPARGGRPIPARIAIARGMGMRTVPCPDRSTCSCSARHFPTSRRRIRIDGRIRLCKRAIQAIKLRLRHGRSVWFVTRERPGDYPTKVDENRDKHCDLRRISSTPDQRHHQRARVRVFGFVRILLSLICFLMSKRWRNTNIHAEPRSSRDIQDMGAKTARTKIRDGRQKRSTPSRSARG